MKMETLRGCVTRPSHVASKCQRRNGQHTWARGHSGAIALTQWEMETIPDYSLPRLVCTMIILFPGSNMTDTPSWTNPDRAAPLLSKPSRIQRVVILRQKHLPGLLPLSDFAQSGQCPASPRPRLCKPANFSSHCSWP